MGGVRPKRWVEREIRGDHKNLVAAGKTMDWRIRVRKRKKDREFLTDFRKAGPHFLKNPK